MQPGHSWKGSGWEFGLALEPQGHPQVWADHRPRPPPPPAPELLPKVISEGQILRGYISEECNPMLQSCLQSPCWLTYLGQSVCLNLRVLGRSPGCRNAQGGLQV